MVVVGGSRFRKERNPYTPHKGAGGHGRTEAKGSGPQRSQEGSSGRESSGMSPSNKPWAPLTRVPREARDTEDQVAVEGWAGEVKNELIFIFLHC